MYTIEEVKKTILDKLNLGDIDPDEIGDDDPLFGEGLGLDSVDAVELVLVMDEQFHVKMKDMSEAQAVFTSFKTMTDYINRDK